MKITGKTWERLISLRVGSQSTYIMSSLMNVNSLFLLAIVMIGGSVLISEPVKYKLFSSSSLLGLIGGCGLCSILQAFVVYTLKENAIKIVKKFG
jgi:hypothetical protein